MTTALKEGRGEEKPLLPLVPTAGILKPQLSLSPSTFRPSFVRPVLLRTAPHSRAIRFRPRPFPARSARPLSDGAGLCLLPDGRGHWQALAPWRQRPDDGPLPSRVAGALYQGKDT